MATKRSNVKTAKQRTMPELSQVTSKEQSELWSYFGTIAGEETIIERTTVYGEDTGHIGYFVVEDFHGRTVTVGVEVCGNYDDHCILNGY